MGFAYKKELFFKNVALGQVLLEVGVLGGISSEQILVGDSHPLV